MKTRWLWVPEQQLRSEAAVTSLIETCEQCHITHLVPILHRWDGALLNSTMLIQSPHRLGRLMPINYLSRRAHEAGVEVYPWWILGSATEWINSWNYCWPGGFPAAWNTFNLSDCDTHWLNFGLPEVRQTIADITADLQTENPGLDGLSIDYIRYEGGMVQEIASLDKSDIDQTIQGVADACAWPLSMSGVPAYVAGDYVGGWDTLGCGQDWPAWVADGIILYVKAMNYMKPSYLEAYLTRHYDDNLAAEVREHVVNGINLSYTNPLTPEEFRESIEITLAHGYQIAVFDSHLLNPNYEQVLADYPLEDEMNIVEMLRLKATELRTMADEIDAAADTLAAIDVTAEAAVVEAQEALEAAQAVEEAL